MSTIQDILSEDPVRIIFAVVATAIFYSHIVLLMRISGKRSLAEMSTFDFVTNVSIGSILPAAIVTRGIAFWTGLAVLTMLVLLQHGVTWVATRSRRFEQLVTNPPRLIFFGGQFLDHNLKEERVTQEQVRSKLRERGYASLDSVHAVVIETSGALAVLQKSEHMDLLDPITSTQAEGTMR